jgi:hypothetical protein
MLLLAAAVVVIAVVAVVVLSKGSSKTGGGSPAATTSGSTVGASTKHKARAHHTTVVAPANAAEINVAVLNGTETTGLAHRVSTKLQQRGYSQATAVSGRPSGSNQSTVVEYAAGHHGDAQAVARSLSVTNVQPLESSAAALAGSAGVVVVVGADTAAESP